VSNTARLCGVQQLYRGASAGCRGRGLWIAAPVPADTRSGQRGHWLAAMHVAVRESAAAFQQHAAPCMLQRERTRLRCLWPCHVAFVCCESRWNARRVLQWVSEPAAAALAAVAGCFSVARIQSSRPPPLERLGFGLREALVGVVPQQLRGATRAG
jgi:hypothetical protein